MIKDILSCKNIEGVTISGGEPFGQIDALFLLVKLLKENPNFNIIIFTGFLLQELQKLNNKMIRFIIQNCDVLIDGKFEISSQVNDPWRGSKNQTIHFLSLRYGIEDYKKAYENMHQEYFVKNGNGEYFVSGIPS